MAVIVENLTKIYGTQKAVNDITFEIKTGEVVGFLGPNGAGKSTTMKMITCFIAPDQGTIRVDNFTAQQDPREIRKRIDISPSAPILHKVLDESRP